MGESEHTVYASIPERGDEGAVASPPGLGRELDPIGVDVADNMYLLSLPGNQSPAVSVPQCTDLATVNDSLRMPGPIERPGPAGLIAGIESLEVIDQPAGVPSGHPDSLVVVHAFLRIPERGRSDPIATAEDA